MKKSILKKIDAVKATFDSLQFTHEEALILRTELGKWIEKLQPPENVNFGVIYRDKDFHTEILPYIDYKRLDEIWGVEVNGVKISCKRDVCSWNKAVKTAQAEHCRLFTVKEVEQIAQNVAQIEDALIFLQGMTDLKQYVYLIGSWILTSEEVDEKYVTHACTQWKNGTLVTAQLAKREGAPVRYTL